MRPKIILASLTSLSLSIVSTTFVLLALTSNRWSIQKYYETLVDGGSPIAWTDPVCVAHRSPFYRCGIPSVSFNATTNVTTCEIPDCAFYAPSGWNQTSCRLPVETGTEDNSLNGGARYVGELPDECGVTTSDVGVALALIDGKDSERLPDRKSVV